jgi:DNA polymerase-3 subunit beta
MEIAFNSKALVEMLSILETESIQLSLSEPSRAGILTPFESKNPQEEILMLVMPVMITR